MVSAGSGCSATTSPTRSTLAQITCPSADLPAVARTTAVRRGSTCSTVVRWSGHSRITHQSPVHGASVGSCAMRDSTAPPQEARTGPVSVSTPATPLSTRTTRPNVASAVSQGAKDAAVAAS